MKTITLLRKSVKRNNVLAAYSLDLEITQAYDITKALFVKQRHIKFDGTIEDVFVAVASPATIAEFSERSPREGSSYFRDSKISIVSTHPDFLEEAFDTILSELQQLVDEAEVLDAMEEDGVYLISSTSITADMAKQHTHYRIPLVALPAGLNNIYIDEADAIKKHSILDEDPELTGWLTTNPGVDPMGYKFKYNIAKDAGLGPVWPVAEDKLQYAHVEVNGASLSDVLINANGIFWKSNLYGEVPWPRSLLSREIPLDDPSHRVVLVFDTIV